jgi:large subunit ribosomal protein L18
MKSKKEYLRIRRQKHIRVKLYGTAQRPRLAIHRSLKNLSAQLVDDITHRSIFSMNTSNAEIKQKCAYGGNIKAAVFFGEAFAIKAKEKGIQKVVFDRAGYLYHGRIKSFAEAARKAGLEF